MLAEGLYFGEGPRWHDDRLCFSDFYDHAVKTVDLDGKVETVLEVEGQPSGLGWLPDGRMLVVSMLDRKLLRVEPDGTVVVHADLSAIATFHCNDMVVDGHGPRLRRQLRLRPRRLHARARRRRRCSPNPGRRRPRWPGSTPTAPCPSPPTTSSSRTAP